VGDEPRVEQLDFREPGDTAIEDPKNTLYVWVNKLDIAVPKIRERAIESRQTLQRQVTGKRKSERRGSGRHGQ